MQRHIYAQLILLCCSWSCSVKPPEGVYRCADDADCPSPQVCDLELKRCLGAARLSSSRADAGTSDSAVDSGGTRADQGRADAGKEAPVEAATRDAGADPQVGRDAANAAADSGVAQAPQSNAECKPKAERCDNLDNDCDTRIDEHVSEACGTDEGECMLGERRCAAGRWDTCISAVSPQREQCDGRDNDCNGTVDDGIDCELSWTRVSVAPGPTEREQSAHGYDSDRKQLVIHGGFWNNMGTADTWALDVATNTWRQLSDTGPSPRRDHAMAYDSTRKRFVLFGGFTGDSGLADTWELDGQTWLERQTEHIPPSRSLHAMVYDPDRQRVVLFGGFSNGDVSAQTWEYDGLDWQERVISGPSARRSPALTYDSEHKRVLLFGGTPEWGAGDEVTPGYNDLWAYDGATWQQLTAADPPRARWFASLVWHPVLEVAFLYGGVQMLTNLSDTHAFDGTRWIDRSSALGMPEVSYSASIIYDPVGDRLLSFGGTTAANNHTDAVWQLD